MCTRRSVQPINGFERKYAVNRSETAECRVCELLANISTVAVIINVYKLFLFVLKEKKRLTLFKNIFILTFITSIILTVRRPCAVRSQSVLSA